MDEDYDELDGEELDSNWDSDEPEQLELELDFGEQA